jgi:hypothetical protein
MEPRKNVLLESLKSLKKANKHVSDMLRKRMNKSKMYSGAHSTNVENARKCTNTLNLYLSRG